MGTFLSRLNNVVLLFKNCPSTSRTLFLSNSNNGFLPHHTFRMRLLSVVLFFTATPDCPLMMSLGSKALFLRLLTTFMVFRPFFVSFFWFFLDVGLAKRSFFTLSMYGCSPCVKVGKGCWKTGSGLGASVAAVSTVRLGMVGCWRVNGYRQRCVMVLGLVQRLFDTVSGRTSHGSQGGRFGRGDGGGYESQERKEPPVLTVSSWHAFDATSSTTTASGHATRDLSRSPSSSFRSSLDGHLVNNEVRVSTTRVFLDFAPVLAVGRIDVTASTHLLGTRPKLFREDVIVAFQMSLGRVRGRRGEGPGRRRFGRRRRREERQERK